MSPLTLSLLVCLAAPASQPAAATIGARGAPLPYPRELQRRPACTRILDDDSYDEPQVLTDVAAESLEPLARLLDAQRTRSAPQGCGGPHVCEAVHDMTCTVSPTGQDVFKKASLFSTSFDRKQTLVQLRVQQRYYLLAAYYFDVFEETFGHPNEQGGMDTEHVERKGWRRTPQVLLLGNNDDNASACVPEKCPGYFCFDLVDVRRKGEAAIVGHTCERVAQPAGEVETLTIWQATTSGFKEVAVATVRTKSQVGERRWVYELAGDFPKKLVLREKLTGGQLGPPMELPLAFDP